MNEPDSTYSSPKGIAKSYSVVGRKLLTVTATSAVSDDSLIESLLQGRRTFPGHLPFAEEHLKQGKFQSQVR